MTECVSIENSGLSARSRPKVKAFVPVLKNVDKNFVIGSEIDVDMAIGHNWLVRKPLIAIFKEAVKDITEKDLNYPLGVGGPSPVLTAFASFFNQFFSPSIPIEPDHVVTFSGASTCLDGLLYAICDEGDSIILPSPFWAGYVPFTKFRANVNIATTSDVPWRSTTSIDIVAAVKKAYSSAQDSTRIKALLMANPHNPTGKCYPSSVIRELMVFCKDNGLHYISDEIFAMSSFSKDEEGQFTSALSLVSDNEESPMDPSRLHVIYSMSKDWGSPGLRMACLVSSRNRPVLEGSWISNYMQTSNLNNVCVTALFHSPNLPSIISSLKNQLTRNYGWLTKALNRWGIEYIPTHAGFHIFARLVKNAQSWDDEAAGVKQLFDAGIMVTPGKSFGGIDGEFGWVRLSFSIEEKKLREGLWRIGQTLGFENDREKFEQTSCGV
ncbi:uncharacterized protein EAE98_011895 [Botrytis deweyae]|uniref:Aminotransferase class I/classII large domain-containing protein n=1 Tax=Botrytis deweyae TaxID=2478750 RepID=A0ABQ7I4V9_9HELO|nr:uncharacterized protein EAE98_011895 [Botrytis deweyae]KAF7911780.1 hypothetical protein EAE98_011895 [Botrytis deweyae]